MLVDNDGKTGRKERLEGFIEELRRQVERLIAVSVEEFEAWLIADTSAVISTLSATIDKVGDPESLELGEAKSRLQGGIADHTDDEDEHSIRQTLVRELDLQRVADRCEAFETFVRDLETAVEHLDS
ncbi:MAG: DUF4276 family protein [Bradymonadaceae bacterium]